jgi:hypothetical protein
MFLKLNSSNLSIISKNEKDVELHKAVFDIDLSRYEEIDRNTINFINIKKQIIYSVVEVVLEAESK